MITSPSVVSVNVGAVREVEWRGRLITTGLWKHPATGRVPLRGVNFAGDDQADRTVHGGVDKAVYAYSTEDYEFWREHEGIDTPVGLFGENLTLSGIELSSALVGERWSVGTALLAVAPQRLRCFQTGVRLGDPVLPKRFRRARRPGGVWRAGAVGGGQARGPSGSASGRPRTRPLESDGPGGRDLDRGNSARVEREDSHRDESDCGGENDEIARESFPYGRRGRIAIDAQLGEVGRARHGRINSTGLGVR